MGIDYPRPIRVVRLIARLDNGGPAVYVTLLMQHLHPPEYECTLVCGIVSPDEGDMQYFAEERGIHPVIIPDLGRELYPLRDILTLWKVYRLIREIKPHIVETHTAKAGFIG